jgi:hypothetical protein
MVATGKASDYALRPGVELLHAKHEWDTTAEWKRSFGSDDGLHHMAIQRQLPCPKAAVLVPGQYAAKAKPTPKRSPPSVLAP